MLLLFGLFPSREEKDIVLSSKGVIQYAANALQYSFLEGLLYMDQNIDLLNLPYIGSFPFLYKKIFNHQYYFNYYSSNHHYVNAKNVFFVNLLLCKNVSRYYSAKKNILFWCETRLQNQDKIIVIYAIHTPFIKAAVDAKKRDQDIKICLIVPDLPEHMSDKNHILYNYFKKYNTKLLNSLYEEVDAFVLLSKYMADVLPVRKKPWIVIEGIFNNVLDDILYVNSKHSYKQIFYAGTLARRYGILNLVSAFISLSNIDYRLIICGDGDAVNEIIKLAEKDTRIIFKGQLDRKEVLKLQKESDLLVNPRTSEGEFTKYSFPSKTMEYLASGIPTLLYKLPGIPDEYYEYCFTIDSLDINDLSNKMDEILKMDNNYLRDFGAAARSFILTKKNPVEQCKKVMELINKL